ncbi:hypothetical protein [Mycobacterium sp. D16R24]|uniref:hypothetical protein n=1 Tax=Mycobacterium sp. D16R24 TaxID=1855656 RepID=UPI0009947FE7|nr:hypothetical protein [Mycobacterium sp. D16R24]
MDIPDLPSSDALRRLPPEQRVKATQAKLELVQEVFKTKRLELDSLTSDAGTSDDLVHLEIQGDGQWKQLSLHPAVTTRLTNVELQEILNEIFEVVNEDARSQWAQCLSFARPA